MTSLEERVNYMRCVNKPIFSNHALYRLDAYMQPWRVTCQNATAFINASCRTFGSIFTGSWALSDEVPASEERVILGYFLW